MSKVIPVLLHGLVPDAAPDFARQLPKRRHSVGCMVMSKRRNIKSLEAEKSRLDTLFCEANYAIWRELSTEGTKTPNWAMRKKKREIEFRKLIEREDHRVDDLFEEAAKMSPDLDAAKTQARFVLTWTLSRLSKHV